MTKPSPHLDDELLVALAFGEIDEPRRSEIDAHLDGCAECRREYVDLLDTLGTLAYAAPPAVPPADLRADIIDAARGSAAAPTHAESAARRRLAWPVWFPRVALAGGLAALAVAVGLVVVTTSDATRSVALQGTSGTVLVSAHRAALAPSGFAPAPTGRTYEMWIIRRGVARPAGLFGSGTSFAAVTVPVDAGDVFAVTTEPAGGSLQPTSVPIARARI